MLKFLNPSPQKKRGPMISLLPLCQYVSRSVSKPFFSETAHRIFLKLLMKLVCFKGKKLKDPDFQEDLGIMRQIPPNRDFFGFCKKISPLTCRFFGFKSCTIMSFMILLNLEVWENLVPELNAKMLSVNQIALFLNFNISKTIAGITLTFFMQKHVYESYKLMM